MMRLRNIVICVSLAIWALCTLAALAAMYHLWWTRERVQYQGKSSAQQREVVFRLAGFPATFLQDIEELRSSWSPDARYSAEGDFNRLSYVKYLLIPRMPSGSGDYFLRAQGDRLAFEPRPGLREDATAPADYPARPAAFLLSLLAVSGVCRLLRSFSQLSTWTIPECFALAVFLLMSCALLSRGICAAIQPGFIIFSAAGTVGLVTAVVTICRNPPWRTSCPSACGRLERGGIVAAAGIMAAAAVWSTLMAVVVVPDDWDAWAMWGAKAKTLALGSGPLGDVALFGHGDYPLLWPVVWAFSGWCAGGWEEHWSRAWGIVFMLLTAWQAGLVVRRMTGNVLGGWLTAALLLTMPKMALLASWSYAESPYWLMLACAGGAMLQWQQQSRPDALARCVLFCALAAYTKNEGLLFWLFSACWLFAVHRVQPWRAAAWHCAGLVLLYLPWLVWMRTVLRLDSRHLDGLVRQDIPWAALLDRLGEVVAAIAVLWTDVRQWNVVLAGLVVSAILLSFRHGQLRRALLIPGGMALAYLLLTLSHADPLWLVATAWDRLTGQLLVLLLLMVGCAILPRSGPSQG